MEGDFREPSSPRKTLLRAVVVGSTNVCNASCVHCPTGKEETEHLLRGTMSMDLFHSLVDQVAEQCTVTDGFMFCLHGDPLLDKLLVDRARYVKEKLPGTGIWLSTNAAAYSTEKHAILAEVFDAINIHIKSLRPDVYDFIMRPLRFERVAPKIEMMLRDFHGKASVAVPLHRLNLAERQAMTDYFLDRGAASVQFGAISNRCSSNGLFEHLAFSPIYPGCRSPLLLDYLIVDWDGVVLGCCNDFKREEPIGDMRTMSLCEVLDGPARREFARKLDAGEWSGLKPCSNCRWDKCGHVGLGVHSPPLKEEEPTGPAAELRAVYASTSWRLTAPLRALRRALSDKETGPRARG